VAARGPAGRLISGTDRRGWSMPVGPPTMPSAYHLRSRRSGDIAGSYDGQLHVADSGIIPQSGLTMEQLGNALVTQAPEGAAGGQELAVTSTNFADNASPSATVADTWSLVTKIAISHVSLSPLEREPLGK
jgi:hypothetical protein